MTGISLIDQKKALRQLVAEQKKQLNVTDRILFSAKIFDLLEQNELYQHAQTVLCFWSMPDEVDTHAFMLNHLTEKVWLLPVVKNNSLEIRKFNGVQDLRQGVLHIEEPVGDPFEGNIDLAVIPGMAFDRFGNRLGRGKGYYDQFLAQHHLKTIAVAFHCQLVEQVPVDKWDVRMNQVITEKGIIIPSIST
ncbi:MAG: 5-formyltetrahydrofolate cyclo-ligase [Microbacter sp.]